MVVVILVLFNVFLCIKKLPVYLKIFLSHSLEPSSHILAEEYGITQASTNPFHFP